MRLLNERAFNLFTALISFVLIILSVLLTQSMIQTERQTNDTIAGIESRSELQAVADMTRADAIQVFNFGLRERIEDWLADRDRGRYTIELADKSWRELQNDYAEAKFGGTRSIEFADFAANSLISLFYSEAHYGNYSVSLENAQTLREVLQKAIQTSVQTGEFFEVVECDMDLHKNDPRQCRKGTFYVTLAIAALPFEDYEKLPRLRIRNKATGDEIKEVILPRANFRIFVPVRLFKALAEARAIAHQPLQEENTQNDSGLFSAKIHNQIEQMALGMCDRDYCAPRKNPFLPPPKKTIKDSACPGAYTAKKSEVSVSVECDNAGSFCTPGSYNASDEREMERTLAGMVREGLCRKAGEIQTEFLGKESDFGLITTSGANCGVMRVEVQADSEISKQLIRVQELEVQEEQGFSGGFDAESCSRNNPGERIGLYKGPGGKTAAPIIPTRAGACTGPGGDDGQSQCSEVTRFTATMLFQERNPLYKVNRNRDLVFEIKLLDNKFAGFAPAYKDGAALTACYFSQPTPSTCSYATGQGWNCQSVRLGTDLDNPLKDVGCVPS